MDDNLWHGSLACTRKWRQHQTPGFVRANVLVTAGCSRFNQDTNLDQTQELGQNGTNCDKLGQNGTNWDRMGQKKILSQGCCTPQESYFIAPDNKATTTERIIVVLLLVYNIKTPKQNTGTKWDKMGQTGTTWYKWRRNLESPKQFLSSRVHDRFPWP